MPRHSDFEKIYQAFIKRYGQVEGEKNYFAWLSKMGLDDTKSYSRPQESLEKFDWAQSLISYLREDETKKYYKVEAAFPLSSMNDNVYTDDELLRGARSLVGKPVNLNHVGSRLDTVSIDGAEYENGAVEAVLSVLKGSDVLGMIERGDIVHVSIEADCLQGTEPVADGSVCKGLVFTGLALLTKDVLPGVPLTRIMPVEKLVESFTVPLEQEKEMSEQQKKEGENTTENRRTDEGEVSPPPNMAKEIADLKAEMKLLKEQVTEATKPPEPPKPPQETPKTTACKPCVLTKEGFWTRFHELRGEGLSKSDAFRVVSLEVIETASRTGKP
jgi:hypothetical protein